MSCGCPSISAPRNPAGCVPAVFCPPENFNLSFPSLVGPMGPPGGPGTYVENYAALRVIDPSVFTQGYVANVGGYATSGDGGGGQFQYEPVSVAADNDGTVLSPANAIGRWVRIFSGAVNLNWFGGFPSSPDCLAAFDNALGSFNTSVGGKLYVPAGTHLISDEIDLTKSNVTIYGDGYGSVIKAKDGADFETMITATGRTGLLIEAITIDVNQANRAAFLTTRSTGIDFVNCTDCMVAFVRAQNAIGSLALPGFAFGVGGAIRAKFIGCTALNCGILGKAADGFFTSGTQNLMSGCTATNCLDTGFVIETSQESGISGCTARACGAGAAITNASSATASGNYIDGLTIFDWTASVTGAIQIGNPDGATTGHLLDTTVADVVIRNVTGTGPGINVRRVGAAKTIGLTLDNVIIQGAGTQGILVNGEKVEIIGGQIAATGACILIQDGCVDVKVSGVTMVPAAQAAVGIGTGCDQIEIGNCKIRGNGATSPFGVYCFGTSTNIRVKPDNDITGTVVARVAADNGTSPYSVFDVLTLDALPATGLWKYGQTIFVLSPLIGGPTGWRCTTAGLAPGTAVFTPFGWQGTTIPASLPAASATLRGGIVLIKFGAGIDDELWCCMKKADDLYYWRVVTVT